MCKKFFVIPMFSRNKCLYCLNFEQCFCWDNLLFENLTSLPVWKRNNSSSHNYPNTLSRLCWTLWTEHWLSANNKQKGNSIDFLSVVLHQIEFSVTWLCACVFFLSCDRYVQVFSLGFKFVLHSFCFDFR